MTSCLVPVGEVSSKRGELWCRLAGPKGCGDLRRCRGACGCGFGAGGIEEGEGEGGQGPGAGVGLWLGY